MSKKAAVEKPTVMESFTLTIDPKKPTIVPVVPSLDELPRSARRRLRNVIHDSTLDRALTAGPKYEQFVDYALAYAATQGVRVDLDSEELDDTTADRVRMELVVAGLNLMTHFNRVEVGDEGNAESPDEGTTDPG